MFDWWWLLSVPIAAIVARVVRMGRELDTLTNKFDVLKAEDALPFPSDESEEMKAIKIAKALYKSAGEKFTWTQAKKVGKHIREQQRRREEKAQETPGGDSSKRTA